MDISWIEEGKLCAAGLPFSRHDVESLHEQGVRAIVTLTEYPLTDLQGIRPELFARLEMTVLHVPIIDHHAPTRAQVEQIAAFIDTMVAQKQPVFVQCLAGIGRTGTALHAYYLLKGDSFAKAKARVQEARPISEYSNLSDVQQAFLEELAASIWVD
jgi:protein-tyrosine phosphatase